jgi:hypothetical protein
MHTAVNILMVQSRIDDMHRAGAASRLATETRRRAAGASATAERAQLQPMSRPSLFRRVVTRFAV